MNAGALPANADVEIANGGLDFAYGGSPANLAKVVLRGGELSSVGALVVPDEITVYEGRISARLAGGATLNKLGDGTLNLVADNSNFTGDVVIHRGRVVIADGAVSEYGLGAGTTIVEPDGELAPNYHRVRGNIELAGGNLGGSTSSVQSMTAFGAITVSADSTFSGDTLAVGDFTADARLRPVNTISKFTVSPGVGKTVRGVGDVDGGLTLAAGGTLAPGHSAGAITFDAATFGAGGVYNWELVDVDGAAGADWDLLSVDGTLTVAATGADPFTVRIAALAGSKEAAFDSSRPYSWAIARAATVTGFAPGLFAVDASGFGADTGGGSFAVSSNGTQIAITFAPVPEPTALSIVALVAGALSLRRRAR
jgi:autotransporter-associated beta strand protein